MEKIAEMKLNISIEPLYGGDERYKLTCPNEFICAINSIFDEPQGGDE